VQVSDYSNSAEKASNSPQAARVRLC
jgi:hypothetical protein